jgi:hypothetical protein
VRARGWAGRGRESGNVLDFGELHFPTQAFWLVEDR